MGQTVLVPEDNVVKKKRHSEFISTGSLCISGKGKTLNLCI